MRNETQWGRGIILLVIAGAALGVLYNAAGLMSHPKRGIPWLAATNAMAELDTLAFALPDSEAPAAQEAAGAEPEPAETAGQAAADTPPASPPSPTAKSEGAGGAAPPRERVSTPPSKSSPAPPAKSTPAPKTASVSTAKPGSTATAPAATAPAAAKPAPPPFIPESDRPVRISLATAKSLFDAGAALFMDARDPPDYEAGHIPGALRMTRDEALGDPDRVKALPVRGRPIVAYCSGGVCEASLELAQALVDAGYRKVLVYGGGFPDWEAAGYPVAQGGEGK
jgi:rhodanese-related sulfurtransferase